MAKTKSSKRQNRELLKIQNAGITAFVLGLLFLIAPIFAKNSKVLKPLADNLASSLSWVFILLGIGLIGVYTLLKPKDKSEKDNSATPNTKPSFLTSLTEKLNIKLERQWSKQVFADIEWRRFEAVCEGFFTQSGLKTKSQSHGADGGVDIWMYSAHAEGPVSIAQCKHWRNEVVTVKEIREFYGVMSSHKLQRGTFVTTSTYTADAQKFANENGINALDGDKLLKLIASRTAEQQKELLDIAYEGEYAVPTCASCGIKMVKRTKFWGCKNYPRCKSQIYFKAA
jgi:restriction system protein